MRQEAEVGLDLEGNVLHRLHLLLQTLLLAFLRLILTTSILLLFLILFIVVFAPAAGEGEEEDVGQEGDEEAEGDHPGLEQPDGGQVAAEGRRALRFALPVEDVPGRDGLRWWGSPYLPQDDLRVPQARRHRLHPVHVLVECGELELGVRLVLIFELAGVEGSDGGAHPGWK